MNRAINYQECCPECGAPEANGLDCRGQLDEIISWEAENADLLGLHFWTVACYNIQHPAIFTDEAREELFWIFCEAYDRQMPISKVRKKISYWSEGSGKVVRQVPAQPVFKDWAMTVSEVYLVGEKKGAADRVRAWTKVVRKQL
ncbi:hypothetical protein D1B31_03550 [Neobacillus notoginsengisoli]|uniref:Uncharacterized protein n=1 Tax=Neobacillus notoginsengisoli TaxID=1578198 RepID=A0A417YY28_9BACI|nr:DUF5946 family protein [Neobacillus notoginsengisoli]RHW42678.1 hypothetical protein D1B31_03550 [Neobacillus notoginsengisoli]